MGEDLAVVPEHPHGAEPDYSVELAQADEQIRQGLALIEQARRKLQSERSVPGDAVARQVLEALQELEALPSCEEIQANEAEIRQHLEQVREGFRIVRQALDETQRRPCRHWWSWWW